MKSRIMYILLVFLLSTSITACSGSKSDLNLNNSSSVNNSKNTDTSPSSDSKSENINTTNNSVLEAYKAVLLNNAEFFSVDNKKKLSLNDFLTNKEIYGTILKVTQFTVLDMDGDDVPEVILELAVDNNPEFYEVLHYMDDTVYGYNIVYRGLEGLKTDGTFQYSNGAADNGYGKLKFQSNVYETDIFGYMKSSQNNDDITISYFINNESVTKESYNSFIEEQGGKEDVVWHEFSQENVEAEKEYYFEPSVSTIEGILITRMYYGPPGYGENPDTDAQEHPFILQLDDPIQVIAQEGDINNSDRSEVTEIQVVPMNQEDIELVNQYIDKRIIIQGTLFLAHTGHHHTDVLMQVEKILD